MRARLTLGMVGLSLALGGCDNNAGRGGLSAEEERQLDNAAKMLDENMIDASPDSLTLDESELNALDEQAGGDANAQ
ncbi:MAG: hypothetical protein ACT4OE_03095 [Sphingosinicella sp.]